MSARRDILVIDDDRDLVETLCIVLEGKNYEVRRAYNGKEGFSRIEEKVPDLIILDVMMTTDTEGFDLAFKLRNNPAFQQVPILMLTSFPKTMAEEGPDRFQHILGEAWPVSVFLEKPVDPEILIATVADILLEQSGE